MLVLGLPVPRSRCGVRKLFSSPGRCSPSLKGFFVLKEHVDESHNAFSQSSGMAYVVLGEVGPPHRFNADLVGTIQLIQSCVVAFTRGSQVRGQFSFCRSIVNIILFLHGVPRSTLFIACGKQTSFTRTFPATYSWLTHIPRHDFVVFLMTLRTFLEPF